MRKNMRNRYELLWLPLPSFYRSFTICQRELQYIATKICKIQANSSSTTMTEYFQFIDDSVEYNRSCSACFGTKSSTKLGVEIWDLSTHGVKKHHK